MTKLDQEFCRRLLVQYLTYAKRAVQRNPRCVLCKNKKKKTEKYKTISDFHWCAMSAHPLPKLHGYGGQGHVVFIHHPVCTFHDQTIHRKLINTKSWWSDRFLSIICTMHISSGMQVWPIIIFSQHLARCHTLRPCWRASEKASIHHYIR